MSSQQHFTELLGGLEQQGCMLKRTTRGWQVLFPTGGMATVHLTLSDYRGERNLRSVIRRHGMRWPFDK